ncbi:unnamed protein product [Jaminaea pallidilutea]
MTIASGVRLRKISKTKKSNRSRHSSSPPPALKRRLRSNEAYPSTRTVLASGNATAPAAPTALFLATAADPHEDDSVATRSDVAAPGQITRKENEWLVVLQQALAESTGSTSPRATEDSQFKFRLESVKSEHQQRHPHNGYQQFPGQGRGSSSSGSLAAQHAGTLCAQPTNEGAGQREAALWGASLAEHAPFLLQSAGFSCLSSQALNDIMREDEDTDRCSVSSRHLVQDVKHSTKKKKSKGKAKGKSEGANPTAANLLTPDAVAGSLATDVSSQESHEDTMRCSRKYNKAGAPVSSSGFVATSRSSSRASCHRHLTRKVSSASLQAPLARAGTSRRSSQSNEHINGSFNTPKASTKVAAGSASEDRSPSLNCYVQAPDFCSTLGQSHPEEAAEAVARTAEPLATCRVRSLHIGPPTQQVSVADTGASTSGAFVGHMSPTRDTSRFRTSSKQLSSSPSRDPAHRTIAAKRTSKAVTSGTSAQIHSDPDATRKSGVPGAAPVAKDSDALRRGSKVRARAAKERAEQVKQAVHLQRIADAVAAAEAVKPAAASHSAPVDANNTSSSTEASGMAGEICSEVETAAKTVEVHWKATAVVNGSDTPISVPADDAAMRRLSRTDTETSFHTARNSSSHSSTAEGDLEVASRPTVEADEDGSADHDETLVAPSQTQEAFNPSDAPEGCSAPVLAQTQAISRLHLGDSPPSVTESNAFAQLPARPQPSCSESVVPQASLSQEHPSFTDEQRPSPSHWSRKAPSSKLWSPTQPDHGHKPTKQRVRHARGSEQAQFVYSGRDLSRSPSVWPGPPPGLTPPAPWLADSRALHERNFTGGELEARMRRARDWSEQMGELNEIWSACPEAAVTGQPDQRGCSQATGLPSYASAPTAFAGQPHWCQSSIRAQHTRNAQVVPRLMQATLQKDGSATASPQGASHVPKELHDRRELFSAVAEMSAFENVHRRRSRSREQRLISLQWCDLEGFVETTYRTPDGQKRRLWRTHSMLSPGRKAGFNKWYCFYDPQSPLGEYGIPSLRRIEPSMAVKRIETAQTVSPSRSPRQHCNPSAAKLPAPCGRAMDHHGSPQFIPKADVAPSQSKPVGDHFGRLPESNSCESVEILTKPREPSVALSGAYQIQSYERSPCGEGIAHSEPTEPAHWMDNLAGLDAPEKCAILSFFAFSETQWSRADTDWLPGSETPRGTPGSEGADAAAVACEHWRIRLNGSFAVSDGYSFKPSTAAAHATQSLTQAPQDEVACSSSKVARLTVPTMGGHELGRSASASTLGPSASGKEYAGPGRSSASTPGPLLSAANRRMYDKSDFVAERGPIDMEALVAAVRAHLTIKLHEAQSSTEDSTVSCKQPTTNSGKSGSSKPEVESRSPSSPLHRQRELQLMYRQQQVDQHQVDVKERHSAGPCTVPGLPSPHASSTTSSLRAASPTQSAYSVRTNPIGLPRQSQYQHPRSPEIRLAHSDEDLRKYVPSTGRKYYNRDDGTWTQCHHPRIGRSSGTTSGEPAQTPLASSEQSEIVSESSRQRNRNSCTSQRKKTSRDPVPKWGHHGGRKPADSSRNKGDRSPTSIVYYDTDGMQRAALLGDPQASSSYERRHTTHRRGSSPQTSKHWSGEASTSQGASQYQNRSSYTAPHGWMSTSPMRPARLSRHPSTVTGFPTPGSMHFTATSTSSEHIRSPERTAMPPSNLTNPLPLVQMSSPPSRPPAPGWSPQNRSHWQQFSYSEPRSEASSHPDAYSGMPHGATTMYHYWSSSAASNPANASFEAGMVPCEDSWHNRDTLDACSPVAHPPLPSQTPVLTHERRQHDQPNGHYVLDSSSSPSFHTLHHSDLAVPRPYPPPASQQQQVPTSQHSVGNQVLHNQPPPGLVPPHYHRHHQQYQPQLRSYQHDHNTQNHQSSDNLTTSIMPSGSQQPLQEYATQPTYPQTVPSSPFGMPHHGPSPLPPPPGLSQHRTTQPGPLHISLAARGATDPYGHSTLPAQQPTMQSYHHQHRFHHQQHQH